MQKLLRQALIFALYGLPVVFFLVCYFLITVSGEDVIQGAGTAPDIWNDLSGAFHHNSRLSDMFAWTVINFFDYQYSFGIDTIFRLLDAGLALAMIYLLTYLALGRKPRLKLPDAVIFGLSFLTIFLTPHGHVFYRGFSMIHNYLVIALATLAFTLPFVRQIGEQKLPRVYQFWPIALLIGLVFGMSSNVTPIAFLLSYILYKCYRWWQEKSHAVWKMAKWELCLMLGMVITLFIAYVFGNGVSDYANNPVYTETYDYVSFGDLGTNFGAAVWRMLKHLVINLGRAFGPIIIIWLGLLLMAALICRLTRQKLRLWPQGVPTRRVMAVILGFGIVYLGISSQIILPVRLCLPVYLGLTVMTGIWWQTWWQPIKLKPLMPVIGSLMAVAMLALTMVRGYFAWDYRTQTEPVLRRIEAATEDVVCIDPTETYIKELPLIHLAQEETFAEWSLPLMEIYGKRLVFCP